jgi:hypothetical protein
MNQWNGGMALQQDRVRGMFDTHWTNAGKQAVPCARRDNIVNHYEFHSNGSPQFCFLQPDRSFKITGSIGLFLQLLLIVIAIFNGFPDGCFQR